MIRAKGDICWRGQLGFTLIELLVTLALVGILAAIAIPMTDVASRRGKEQELRESLRSVRHAIDAYKQAGDEGRIPRSLDASGYPPSLEALVEGSVDQRDPAGQPPAHEATLAVSPASTTSPVPVTYLDSSQARNSTALLTSCDPTQGTGSR